ncbi:16S rRNA (cytosine(967)-C(5))-methyltransferase RsmB [Ornithinibacillus gellani]|uniref:16S rRNA (cytosine(967)-C(5))-methyltransferase RsmB n=1 Tax=Ornithinibacillus gellani TaxID=2293253 RepID=UPI000F4A5DFE|nr:16S rRNA (cytosine(967)-C(5))-methyltransferase RsmB [Ornithinibacillus gellani]TQS75611.1 16S rRNA (cytosine(967)-C(5))-methyltransferase RsmB [Ornithinibacillus gellani]
MRKYALRNTVLDVLIRIDEQGGYSHLLINHELKKNQIAAIDERLLTEIVYGTLQHKLYLDYVIDEFVKSNQRLKPWVRMLLRMSIYQMFFLDKVPDHAIIHEAVEIAKQRGHRGIASLVNGVLRNVQRQGRPNLDSIKDPIKRLAIETSHPQWLVERWVKSYGYDTTEAMCQANLNHKPISVRVQALRIQRQEAMKQLEQEGFTVKPSPISEQGITIEEGNILKSSLFLDGLLTIQDQSSMLAGQMLAPIPGMQVLDTCSAPGGKATHLAELMENMGTVKAHDLHDKKIRLIKEKAKQLQLSIIDASAMDARKLGSLYSPESFDRILVDAPCSGLGVIRGKPDIKYSKQEADIARLSIIQSDILETVAPLLKQGGKLVYSTCTVDPAENTEVVSQFLNRHPDYEVDPTFFTELPDTLQQSIGVSKYGLQIFPQQYETDGFFLVRFVRHGRK